MGPVARAGSEGGASMAGLRGWVAPLALLLAVLYARAARQEPQHFVFVNRDRARIHDHAFLYTPALAGAQVKYTWRELEPARGRYDLRVVLDDLAFLSRHGKRLVIQLQDASFDERINTPDYLQEDPEFHGGIARKYEARSEDDSKVRFDGWVARRWDPAVSERF